MLATLVLAIFFIRWDGVRAYCEGGDCDDSHFARPAIPASMSSVIDITARSNSTRALMGLSGHGSVQLIQDGKCTDYGCVSVRKDHPCQCDCECEARKDCCDDYGSTCYQEEVQRAGRVPTARTLTS